MMAGPKQNSFNFSGKERKGKGSKERSRRVKRRQFEGQTEKRICFG